MNSTIAEHLTVAERYAILRGQYPIQRGDPDMTIQLTNEQIVRLLHLCGVIAKIQQELPAPPPGFEVDLEIAKHLRSSIEAKNDVLVELGALLG
jgi:hypothetical protein